MRRSSLVLAWVLSLWAIGGCHHVAAPDAAFEDANRPDAYRGDTGIVGFDGGPITEMGCMLDYSNCPAIVNRVCYPSASIGIQPGSTFYFPQCIRIIAGASVHIMADPEHPLEGAPCNPVGTGVDPLPHGAVTTTGNYTFYEPGVYGFYSPSNSTPDGFGMAGLIIVDPPPDGGPPGCGDAGDDASL